MASNEALQFATLIEEVKPLLERPSLFSDFHLRGFTVLHVVPRPSSAVEREVMQWLRNGCACLIDGRGLVEKMNLNCRVHCPDGAWDMSPWAHWTENRIRDAAQIVCKKVE